MLTVTLVLVALPLAGPVLVQATPRLQVLSGSAAYPALHGALIGHTSQTSLDLTVAFRPENQAGLMAAAQNKMRT